jgi:hypothetical protein
MKPLHVFLFLLSTSILNGLEAQTSTPNSNQTYPDAQYNDSKINKPLQKRANEDLFQQRKFINDCDRVTKASCQIPPNYKSNFAKVAGGQTYTISTSGINMWDNYTSISITTDNARIPSNNITALAVDEDDQLWIGTYGAGVVIGYGTDVKPFKIQHVQTHNLFVASIHVDAELVWVKYSNGALECFLNGISCRYFPKD